MGDIASVKAGDIAPKKAFFSETGVSFIRAGSLSRLIAGESACFLERISAETASELGMHLFPKGTILFAKSGMSCMTGNVYVLQEPCYVVSHLACVTTNNTDLSLYLKHFFRWNRPSELIENPAFPSIRLSKIASMELNLPDHGQIAKQVLILERVEGLTEACRHQLSLLDDLVKSRFVEMFESTKWSTAPAGSVLLNMRNGVSPSKAGAFRARVLTLSAITQGFFDAESWKEGTFSSDPPRGKRISAGEFYICRGNGNRDLVGAGEYSDIDYLDLVFPDTMIAARINLDLINAAYLRYAWTRPAVRRQIESRVRTTNGTFKINQRMLSEVLLPIPPLSLQREFAAFAAEVAKSRVVVKKQALKYNDVIRASSETAIIRRGGLA
ncbi:restriction endonuclease subunit S [Enorma phocaeensis]|uniref:restriction endonuclease subunit S n=1 Tax=Enorma phocaeensis TaxID=1871019 RepID=UPI00320A0EF7